MRFKHLAAVLVVCLTFALPIVAEMTVTELEFSGDASEAVGINDRGEIAGSVWGVPGGGSEMVLWTEHEGITYLGRLNGMNTLAKGINERGEIVGIATRVGPFGFRDWRGLKWNRRKGMIEMPCSLFFGVCPDPPVDTFAINDRGEVVGAFQDGLGFLWTEDGVRNIGALNFFSPAWDINDRGEVVGASDAFGGVEVFVWSEQDGMRDLGIQGYAFGVNNRGEVVGLSAQHGFVWSEQDGLRDLGEGVAVAVNEHGDVVGSNGGSAFLWNERDGMLILPVLDGSLSCQPHDINNRLEIVGSCLTSMGWRAVIWRP